jgi:hypothetical protein
MLRYKLVVMAGMLLAGPALAGSWADSLFEEFSKDFGSVPRGPDVVHSFRVKNTTAGIVTISNVRVSCSACGWAGVQKGQLNPGEETTVLVKMFTRQFDGPKTIWVWVQFIQPQFAEVRLWLQCNSRTDVNLAPESLDFGHTKRGTSPAQSTTITMYGSGQDQVTGVESESNYVLAEVKEVARTPTEVSYQLTARLRSDTPAGRWYSNVWVTTSNPSIPRVRVPLSLQIEPSLTINPLRVNLGEVKIGETAERKVIIRGNRPFTIKDIRGGSPSLLVKESEAARKPVHVLTVHLKAVSAGALQRTLHVFTDLEEEGEIKFQAKAEVVP